MSMMDLVKNARSDIVTRLAHDRRGAAVAEFAVLMPVIAAMLAGVVQYGALLYTYTEMVTCARNGARLVAFRLTSPADVQTKVKELMPTWAGPSAIVTVNENDAGLARVSVSVPGTTASILSFVPVPATLSVSITMPRTDL